MNQQPDRTEEAYRAALGVMVEDTPPAPEWEDLLPTEPIRSRSATTPRRGWAAALVAAGIVLVLVGGIAISVIAFGSNEDVIEQPPPTATPTSVPEGVLGDRITAPAYADVPSFTGTVKYYEHDPSLGDPGWQATVEISHAGPLHYQATVLAEAGGPVLGIPGHRFVGDGTTAWALHPAGFPPKPIGDIDNFRYLYFDSEWPSPPWDEICDQGSQRMGSEEWLGRTVAHVACSTTTEDYELWVDEEAGLVLKMAGPLTIGDASIARDGFFEFTKLTFEPVTIIDVPVFLAADLGEFPPFHMVRLDTHFGGTDTDEIWYLDENTVHETVIDSFIAERIGTFELTADGYASNCYTGLGLCERSDISQSPTYRPITWQIPLALVEENCTESGADTVAGRPARHFVCEGVHFSGSGGYWKTETGGGTTEEHWFDSVTELHVKVRREGSVVEVEGSVVEATLLEIDPVFPAGIFDYEAMDFPDSR